MNDIVDAIVFGVDHQKCRFTGRPLEQGFGALHPDAQSIGHYGQMQYELAELTQRRADHAADLQGKITERSAVSAAAAARGDARGAIDEIANIDAKIRNMQSHAAELAAEHEALAVKIAEIGAKFKEEGILARYGTGAVGYWLGQIRDKGWSIPT